MLQVPVLCPSARLRIFNCLDWIWQRLCQHNLMKFPWLLTLHVRVRRWREIPLSIEIKMWDETYRMSIRRLQQCRLFHRDIFNVFFLIIAVNIRAKCQTPALAIRYFRKASNLKLHPTNVEEDLPRPSSSPGKINFSSPTYLNRIQLILILLYQIFAQLSYNQQLYLDAMYCVLVVPYSPIWSFTPSVTPGPNHSQSTQVNI